MVLDVCPSYQKLHLSLEVGLIHEQISEMKITLRLYITYITAVITAISLYTHSFFMLCVTYFWIV